MTNNKIQTILLEDDIIDIFYNENLSSKPYLIRLYNYHEESYEIRADRSDLEELTTILSLVTEKNSRTGIDSADNV